MLTFNQLLRTGNLDPAAVRLVRHTPPHAKHRRVFDSAMRGEDEFRIYQETQGTPQVIAQFRAARQLAGFVVEPTTKQTVFMGIWDQLGERGPTIEAFGMIARSENVVFKTQIRHEFDEYRGRLVIEWGDGERAWVQRADTQDKRISEIKRQREDPSFPGFMPFRLALDQIDTMPVSWSEVLRNARGIYMLVHRATGDQYIGSAYGEGGFLARWVSYQDGHGGNVALRELGEPSTAYDVAVLEVLGSGANEGDVFDRETQWKLKLGTRARGLNRN